MSCQNDVRNFLRDCMHQVIYFKDMLKKKNVVNNVDMLSFKEP